MHILKYPCQEQLSEQDTQRLGDCFVATHTLVPIFLFTNPSKNKIHSKPHEKVVIQWTLHYNQIFDKSFRFYLLYSFNFRNCFSKTFHYFAEMLLKKKVAFHSQAGQNIHCLISHYVEACVCFISSKQGKPVLFLSFIVLSAF